MEPEDSFPNLQVPVTCPYRDPDLFLGFPSGRLFSGDRLDDNRNDKTDEINGR
jgi:hypothetical protein